jgi:hypothetical protein
MELVLVSRSSPETDVIWEENAPELALDRSYRGQHGVPLPPPPAVGQGGGGREQPGADSGRRVEAEFVGV